MIGQDELKHRIRSQIEDNVFPRFSIIIGPTGSGKQLICNYIAKQLHAVPYECGISVDDVRKMITEAYKVSTKVLYIIANADKMSIAAKNALLKVTEEPPQNAYFVMTLTDSNNTLNTIKSRGTLYHMNPYSFDELCQFGNEITKYTLHNADIEIIRDICQTPGEVYMLLGNDADYAKNFYDYVLQVVDMVNVVSGSNAFKIGDKLSFKADDGKYDLKLFWKAFMSICSKRLFTDVDKYASGIKITSKYLQDLRVTGINKQFTFELWLLDIRNAWFDY